MTAPDTIRTTAERRAPDHVTTATARLELEDGAVFKGRLFGHPISVAGEVVFNTGMVGYPEALTDPSYRGQILVLTYPLVGNYGVPGGCEDRFGLPVGFESDRIQALGLVVSSVAEEYSHHAATRSLAAWLCEQRVPGLAGIDTRALTCHLRERGTMLGRITVEKPVPFHDPNSTDLAAQVTVPDVVTYDPGTNGAPPKTVLVIDCGCKAGIIRSLLARGLRVVRVPYDRYFLNLDFDGVVISNGPGDPQRYPATIRNIERALALGRPMLGICLGHQLLALAAGGDTFKLKFGHRSQNQPCIEQHRTGSHEAPSVGRCVITSQNHGYAVRPHSLPADWRVWFVNANDGTVEGIRHVSRPFIGVQFHPEATPGPNDTAWIFDEFAAAVRS